MSGQRVFIVGGPTASGKSALALALAEKLGGEIVNADSLQLFDALPLLTAQPCDAEKSAAPHHLYACLPPDAKTSAADWRGRAMVVVEEILSRHSVPIIVGGTGFYLNALVQGLSPIPAVTILERQQAQDFLDSHGIGALYAEIMRHDPQGAKDLDAQNPRRLVRAYEVFLASGKPLSYWKNQPREAPPDSWRFVTAVIDPPRDVLYTRCDQRFLQMMEQGAPQEVKAFAQKIDEGLVPADTPLTHACGFGALYDYLAGKIAIQEAVTLAQADTRHYAKRQTTWFRHQMNVNIRLESAGKEAVHAVLDGAAA